MEQEKETPGSQRLWIDWKNKVLSFNCAEGFETRDFLSHEERMTYVLEQCSNGFRIQ